jgi:hypothetical protein
MKANTCAHIPSNAFSLFVEKADKGFTKTTGAAAPTKIPEGGAPSPPWIPARSAAHSSEQWNACAAQKSGATAVVPPEFTKNSNP